jgi:hypothetical protein
VDYERIELHEEQFARRCPTGALAWVEGTQSAHVAERPRLHVS